eukprot:COSAG01_NODE_9688_length_2370_cov_1.267283_2_plen_106_part_00
MLSRSAFLLPASHVDWDFLYVARALAAKVREQRLRQLKQRLGGDRRVWVLTHPALPAEPLAMLEIALTDEVAPSIAALVRRPLRPASSLFWLGFPYATSVLVTKY